MDSFQPSLSEELDVVNSPMHYKRNGAECIDVIDAFELGFNLGNATKYILRAGHKVDRIEDLKKAVWYLNREIATSVSKS